MKRTLMFPVHVFKILRAMFILWLLRKVTYPEYLPLTTYGSFLAHKGDVAVLNWNGNVELGEVTASEARDKILPMVTLRLFRRPNVR